MTGYQPRRAQPAGGTGPGGRPGPALAASSGQAADWQARARVARLLAWVSLAWMAAEGGVGLIAGIRAGPVSLAASALAGGRG
jgi:hypothetical protein